MKKVTIIGGGNIGSAMMAMLGAQGKYDVWLYTKRVDKWSHRLEFLSETNGQWQVTDNYTVSSKLEDSVKGADYIFVTVPSFAREELLNKLACFLSDNMVVVFVPACGGAELLAKVFVDKGVTLVGFERVPCVSRVKEYGHSVAFYWKERIRAAVISKVKDKKSIIADISATLSIKIDCLKSYLTVVLTPANPVMHPCRMYSITENKPYDYEFDHNILFYDEWSDRASQLVFGVNGEIVNICNHLAVKEIIPLDVHYESRNDSELTHKIKSIPAFKGILTPMIKTGKRKYVVDYKSRYFSEDFPFGVYILKSLAELCEIKTPYIDMLMQWYGGIASHQEYENIYYKNDIYSVEDLLRFYNPN